jgi:hypothetical protein
MHYSRGARLGGVLLCAALWASACNVARSQNPVAPDPVADARAGGSSPINPSGPSPVIGSGTAVLVGAGDVGWCGSSGVAQTARIIDNIQGQVILPGDLAYMRASADDYRRCFDPEWGRFRSRWRPVPGNHEYENPGAQAYFNYFGGAAGPPGLGYYAFRAATWHVLMMNSNVPMTTGSAQYDWAERELRNNRTRCTAAVWHHPLASSGPNGLNGHVRDVWHLLQQHGAEIVVSGHDHFYERFAPQDHDYRYTPAGIRQFVVGTGGAPVYRPVTRAPNTEAIVQAHGVLKLTLAPTTFEWEFIEASTGRTIDRGADNCH